MKKQSDLSRLMEYAGTHRYLTYSSWVLSALSALLALVPFWYLWKIIREVLEVMPDFGKAQNLIRSGWMAVLFSALSLLVYIFGLMCSHLAAFRVATNLRVKTMEHIVKLPLGFAESFGSGNLRKIVNESSEAAETYLAHRLPDRVVALATPAGLLILLLAFDWRLGILSLIPVFLGFFTMTKMTGDAMRKDMTEYQNALADMSNEAVEYVRGIPVVKTFGQTVFSFKRFKDSIDRYSKWAISYTNKLRLPMMFYTTAINGIFAFLIAAGILFTQNGVSGQFLLNLMFYIIITPVISLTMTKIMFQSEDAMIVEDALHRIDSVLDLEPLSAAVSPVHPADSSIELQDVTYSYDGLKNALDHISLTIGSGRTVAFVGPSGGGKSTLAAVISRFFDPQGGRVLIGGVDVKDMDKEDLMNTVSFVFQNSRLIKASILENVRLGKPDASREEVLEALKTAQCMDILEKLPEGADTVLGTKGIYLSGGEQQRIAIARTLLKNSPIIILDEATAFADPDNENRVQKAFSAVSKGRTVIMIAHRLSTILGADRIFVLKDGKIVQNGTAPQLLEADGQFKTMWENYQTSVQWKVSKEV